MGWFRRKVEAAPVAIEPEPEYSPIDLHLAHRIDSLEQTLSSFAQTVSEMNLQAQLDALRNRIQDVSQLANAAAANAQQVGKTWDMEFETLETKVDAHKQEVSTIGDALTQTRIAVGAMQNKDRELEIAIQQVARQRGGGGGIAGIA